MDKHETSDPSEILRFLPSIDALLQSGTGRRILLECGAGHLTVIARSATDTLRNQLREIGSNSVSRNDLLDQAEAHLQSIWQSEQSKGLQKVINATGVIVHTNLGRAPLSESAQKAVVEKASGYCSLEYDIETGRRGKRGERAESLLAELTGAEAALIVNNCASAAILVLTALCKGGEAIVSRGELVEIGGDFRVPDVMEQSGAVLREVGTTNRTKLADYQRAISEDTKLLVKVHPSNYRIVGFTSVPTIAELAKLASDNKLLLYEDAGSGALIDLNAFGLDDERLISRSIADGADVVTFSGDKLLGAVQAGLIVGRADVIEKLRKHPLYRALRASKLIYAVLEATLEAFRRETHLEEIPVLRMLAMTKAELERRTREFAAKLAGLLAKGSGLHCDVIEGKSVIGGGSAPTVHPETVLLSLWHSQMSVNELEKKMRLSNPPVAARILDERVMIDLRTVAENEESELLGVLNRI